MKALDPRIARLLDAERDRAPVSAEARQHLLKRIEDSLGPEDPGGGSPDGSGDLGSTAGLTGGGVTGALVGVLVGLSSLGMSGDTSLRAETAPPKAVTSVARPALLTDAPLPASPLEASPRDTSRSRAISAPSSGSPLLERATPPTRAPRRSLAPSAMSDGTISVSPSLPLSGELNAGPRARRPGIERAFGPGSSPRASVERSPSSRHLLEPGLGQAPSLAPRWSPEAPPRLKGSGMVNGAPSMHPSAQHLPTEPRLAWTWAPWADDQGSRNGVEVSRITVDSMGNTLLTGRFEGEIYVGGDGDEGPALRSNGLSDIFVVKLDPKGDHVWSKRFGGKGHDAGFGVAVDCDDNVLITGQFSGTLDLGGCIEGQSEMPCSIKSEGADAFLLKLNSAGAPLWSRLLGGGMSAGLAVTTDARETCSAVVIGWFEGALDLTSFEGDKLQSAGGKDAFLVEIDTDGYCVGAHRFGGEGDDMGLDVTMDVAHDVTLVGWFSDKIEIGASLFDGGPAALVAKLDQDGSFLYARRVPKGVEPFGLRVAVGGDGAAILTGSFEGQIDWGGGVLASAGGADAFVAALDGAGDHIWSKRFGGLGDQRGCAVTVDGGGNVVLTGSFQGALDLGGGALVSAGGEDAYVAVLDVNGDHLYSGRFGDEGDQRGYSVAADRYGNVIVSRGTSNTPHLGVGAPPELRDVSVIVSMLHPQ